MGSFFKKVGTGFLVIILSPFIVLAYVLFAVYAVLKFIVLWFIAVSKFFVGEKITDPLDIDRKAANLFEEEQAGKKAKQPAPEAGKFAGATINIYSNKPLDEDFNRPISHFDTVNSQITSEDVKQLSEYETKMIENKKTTVMNEVEEND